MAQQTNLTDNRAEVMGQMNQNCQAWQSAAGLAAVGFIMDMMQHGYSDMHPTYNSHGEKIGEHSAIRDTGDLQRDVNFEAEADGGGVTVGNSLEYAHFVHEGTCKLKGRPYIRDALMKHKGDLERLSASALSIGFDQKGPTG